MNLVSGNVHERVQSAQPTGDCLQRLSNDRGLSTPIRLHDFDPKLVLILAGWFGLNIPSLNPLVLQIKCLKMCNSLLQNQR